MTVNLNQAVAKLNPNKSESVVEIFPFLPYDKEAKNGEISPYASTITLNGESMLKPTEYVRFTIEGMPAELAKTDVPARLVLLSDKGVKTQGNATLATFDGKIVNLGPKKWQLKIDKVVMADDMHMIDGTPLVRFTPDDSIYWMIPVYSKTAGAISDHAKGVYNINFALSIQADGKMQPVPVSHATVRAVLRDSDKAQNIEKYKDRIATAVHNYATAVAAVGEEVRIHQMLALQAFAVINPAKPPQDKEAKMGLLEWVSGIANLASLVFPELAVLGIALETAKKAGDVAEKVGDLASDIKFTIDAVKSVTAKEAQTKGSALTLTQFITEMTQSLGTAPMNDSVYTNMQTALLSKATAHVASLDTDEARTDYLASLTASADRILGEKDKNIDTVSALTFRLVEQLIYRNQWKLVTYEMGNAEASNWKGDVYSHTHVVAPAEYQQHLLGVLVNLGCKHPKVSQGNLPYVSAAQQKESLSGLGSFFVLHQDDDVLLAAHCGNMKFLQWVGGASAVTHRWFVEDTKWDMKGKHYAIDVDRQLFTRVQLAKQSYVLAKRGSLYSKDNSDGDAQYVMFETAAEYWLDEDLDKAMSG